MKLGWSMTVERRSETSKQRMTIRPSRDLPRTVRAKPRSSQRQRRKLRWHTKKAPGHRCQGAFRLYVPIDQLKKPTVESVWCRRSSSAPEVRSFQQASTRFRRPGRS